VAGALEPYRLAALSSAKLAALAAGAAAKTAAEDRRALGRAIKHVMAAAGARADGRCVSGKVKEALSA